MIKESAIEKKSLPVGWERKTLGDVSDFQRGLTYSGKDAVDFSGNIVLRATNIDLDKSCLDFSELKYLNNDFQGIIIRPATVCGYSEKMRFDLSVNILTNFAYNKNYINIFGGEQYRPNLHIDDMCDLYDYLIFADTNKFNGEIFNAGSQNLKIKEIAEIVAKIVPLYTKHKVELNYSKNDDNRSYRITSDKINDVLNFKIKKNIEDAVHDLCKAFEKNLIKDSFNEQFINIKTLQKLNLT